MSKIKSAEEYVLRDESAVKYWGTPVFLKQNVIDLIKEAQRQAIEASLEVAVLKAKSLYDPYWSEILKLKDSEDLKI